MKINIEKIQKSLDELDRRFNDEVDKQEVDNFQLSIYCKAAALELCGWLEETHDELIKEALTENGLEESFITEFDKKFISKIYGLSYDQHLRRLIINAFGFVNITKLESKIPQIDTLKSELNNLHDYRNQLAHKQYLDFNNENFVSAQQIIDTPNKIKEKFNKMYPVLQEIVNYLNSNNL